MDRETSGGSRLGMWAPAALVPLSLVIAACGGSSSGGSTGAGTPDGSSQQTSLSQRLTAAGIDCGAKKLEGHVSCIYQGQTVTVTPGSWAAFTAERKKVCDSGFISAETVVATDDTTLTVAGNYPSQVRGIAKALGIGVEPYCPS